MVDRLLARRLARSRKSVLLGNSRQRLDDGVVIYPYVELLRELAAED